MLLSDHDLRQIDEMYLKALGSEDLIGVSIRLLNDLKEARDRLNQNPGNSSRPPSSRDPWVVAQIKEEGEGGELEIEESEEETALEKADHEGVSSAEDKAEDKVSVAEVSVTEEKKESQKKGSASGEGRKPGKQKGASGCGRTQKLPVTNEVIHRAYECAACGRELGEEAEFIARTGHYVIDIELGSETEPGIRVINAKHIYGDTICSCGHATRTQPHRCQKESEWDVELTEWHIVGPLLMALICCLALRMKLSRPRIRELLSDWIGLHLSVGTINQCIHEAGRAVAPVEDQLIEEVIKSDLLHVDETSWKEKGKPFWLWVFCTARVVLYVIGYRSKETIENLLGDAFTGWLMSDGYQVYRRYKNRLRCWAHLLRKARGLYESLDKEAQPFGKKTLEVLNTLMEAIYQARQGPGENLVDKYQKLLEQFRLLCETYQNAKHEKTRALAREFLNDWEAIFLVLLYPHLPLTNNEAEQALRHWVILRKLCYGTRTTQGSKTFALLASVIDTCRKRNISPWQYLSKTISLRRQGQDALPIPAAL
jgi:transposase